MADSTDFDVEIAQDFDAPRARVYAAFTDADQLARWYGPDGFPADRDTLVVDARAGGELRLTMVSDSDPAMRTGVTARFTRVVPNELLECTQEWDGVPGQDGTWTNRLQVELSDHDGKTRLVLREGPHPPGTADIGRQAWLMMFAKLATLVEG